MIDYLPQFVYGATDGIVTTFAVVAGAAGANLSPMAILAIGIASVLSDGYSMGISSYLSKQSEKASPTCPQSTIENEHMTPANVGVATFLSFVVMGMIPIVPFMISNKTLTFATAKMISLTLALLAFFSVGFIKGTVRKEDSAIYTGLETLGIGFTAAILAYTAGHYVGS